MHTNIYIHPYMFGALLTHLCICKRMSVHVYAFHMGPVSRRCRRLTHF